jgi:putative flippase GtrA
VARVVRCLSVSAFTTVVSLSTLAILAGPVAMQAWRANLIATAIGTVPSYHLNRRWVWGVRHDSSWHREVAPFWLLSFTGLAVSTLAVDRADHLASVIGIDGLARTATLMAANVASFGLLWVAQFILLDRVLFHPSKLEGHDPRHTSELQESTR